MRNRKTGSETNSLMKANIPLLTNEQDRTGKDLRLNPFKEDTRNGIDLIHNLMRGRNGMIIPLPGVRPAQN